MSIPPACEKCGRRYGCLCASAHPPLRDIEFDIEMVTLPRHQLVEVCRAWDAYLDTGVRSLPTRLLNAMAAIWYKSGVVSRTAGRVAADPQKEREAEIDRVYDSDRPHRPSTGEQEVPTLCQDTRPVGSLLDARGDHPHRERLRPG